MKKRLFMLCGFITLLSIVSAYSQTYEMTASAVVGEQGNTATLSVSLINELPLRDFQMVLHLPDGVSIKQNDDDIYIVNISERAKYHTSTVNYHDGVYSIAIACMTAKNIAAGDGVFFEIPLSLDAPVGEYSFTFDNVHASQDTDDNICIDIPIKDFGNTLTITPEIQIEDFQFYTKKVVVDEGQKNVILSVSLKNSESISSFAFDILFPQGVTPYYDESIDDYVIEYGDRVPSRFEIYGEMDGDMLHIEGSTTRNTVVVAGDDALFTIDLTVASKPGKYEISYLNQTMKLSSGSTHQSSDYSGEFIVMGEINPNVLTYSNTPNVSGNPTNFIAKANDDSWIANEVVLVDGYEFSCPTDFNAVNLSYSRDFNNTEWQALYIPFDMSFDEWMDKAEVAEFKGLTEMDEDNDGVNEKISLVFSIVTNGKLEPNRPYLIRALEKGNITFECKDKNVMSLQSKSSTISCTATNGQRFTFDGTYVIKTDMYASGAYALSGGAFKRAASDKVTLKPFRIYLTINSPTMLKSPALVNIRIDDVTSVESVVIEDDDEYYDVQGRKIENPTNGIYIMKGKKVFKTK